MNIDRVKKAIGSTHTPGDGRLTMTEEIKTKSAIYGAKPFYVWRYSNVSTGKVVELWQIPDEPENCDAFERKPGEYGQNGMRLLKRIKDVLEILSGVE